MPTRSGDTDLENCRPYSIRDPVFGFVIEL
jgi:hypothetical protein